LVFNFLKLICFIFYFCIWIIHILSYKVFLHINITFVSKLLILILTYFLKIFLLFLLILVLIIYTLYSLFRVIKWILFIWILIQLIHELVNLFFLHLLMNRLLLRHLNFNSVTKNNAFSNLNFKVRFLIFTHLNLIINV
jgi:hypothetical protein